MIQTLYIVLHTLALILTTLFSMLLDVIILRMKMKNLIL